MFTLLSYTLKLLQNYISSFHSSFLLYSGLKKMFLYSFITNITLQAHSFFLSKNSLLLVGYYMKYTEHYGIYLHFIELSFILILMQSNTNIISIVKQAKHSIHCNFKAGGFRLKKLAKMDLVTKEVCKPL